MEIENKTSLQGESVILKNMEIKTSASYPITESENRFFLAFEDSLRLNGIDPVTVKAVRMGSGGIRCSVSAGIIGAVQLRPRLGAMQYFLDPLKNREIADAPIDTIIAAIPYWTDYLLGLLRLHKAVITP